MTTLHALLSGVASLVAVCAAVVPARADDLNVTLEVRGTGTYVDVAGSKPTLVPTATASSEFVLVDLDMERLRSGDLVYVYAKGSPKVLRTGAGGVVLGAHRRYLTVDAPAPSAPTIYGDAKPVATEIVTDCRGLFEIELVSGGIEVATGASIRLHAHPELCWGDYRPRKAQYKPASILGLAKAGGLLFSDDPAKLAEDVLS